MDMSLIERLGTFGDAKVWYDNFPLESEYTVGIAGERFLRAIKDRGVILGTVCPACDLTYVPPSMYCERCFTQLDEWVELPAKGTVYTFTIVTRSFVKLPGAHGGLVHRLKTAKPEDVEIGMEVEVVFKPQKEREGSILDIEGFKPT
jgi:uncharacterized OB-fold protein